MQSNESVKKDTNMTSTHTTIVKKLVAEEQATTNNLNKLWYDECVDAEEGEIMTDTSTIGVETPIKEEFPLNKSPDSTSNDREILVSFLYSTNEEKYERLLKEEKIKTTFKRRLSPNSSIVSSGSNEKEQNLSDRDSGQSSPRSSDHSPSGKRLREIETDDAVLERRQKQIDYGKNTIGYDFYSKQVAKEKRTKDHPWTPRKDLKYSRRAFDGLVKVWRKKLHCYDPASMKHIKTDDTEESTAQEI